MVGVTGIHRVFHRIAVPSSQIFSSKLNPLYHLGAITIFLLLIDSLSGIYLFIFYKIDPRYSFSSVETISSSIIGNIMRGIHRYSSDALILTTLLHALHVIITDRFRLFRWVAWFTGIISLIIFLAIGITGYILVWDTKAQIAGIFTGKFLSFLPIFGGDIMSTFFGTDIKYLGGLFRMLLYFHIALTIVIVFLLWLHVMRNARARIIPPRYIWVNITIILIILSMVLPAKSDPEASLQSVPFEISNDWFYFFILPLIKIMPLSKMWLLLSVLFFLFVLFPWIVKGKRNPPVRMNPERCVGCEQCYHDCPYEAVVMLRQDGKKKSHLNERKCAGCGICVGACSFNAIDFSLYEWKGIIEKVKAASPQFVGFSCAFAASLPEREGLMSFQVPCAGVIHPDHVRELMINGAKGVVIVACEEEDCHFREGTKWLIERYERRRKPFLKEDVDPSKVKIILAHSVRDISPEVDTFIMGTNQKREERAIEISSYKRIRYAMATILLLIPAFFLYPLSVDRVSFYPKDKSLLILSFKYRSTPSLAMARSPIQVDVSANEEVVFSKTYNPRGIRKDASIFVYEEITLNPGEESVKIRLRETLFPEKVKELDIKGSFPQGKGLVVTYDDLKKELFYLGKT